MVWETTNICLLSFVVINQITVSNEAVSETAFGYLNVLMVIVFLAAVKRRTGDEDIIAYVLVYHLVYSIFVSFVRYQMESAERQFFVISDSLRCRVKELELRRAALLEAVSQFIPKVLVDRSACRPKGADSSEQATVVAVGLHDLAVFASGLRPMEVAALVDTCVNVATQGLREGGLDRVSVLFDEVVAVGGLIGNQPTITGGNAVDRIRRLTVQATNTVLQMIEHNAQGAPIRAGIDVGPASGRFERRGRIRYDVTGEAVVGARVVLLHAKRGETLLTERAALQCGDSVELASEADSVAWMDVAGMNFEGRCACALTAQVEKEVSPSVVVVDTSSSNEQEHAGLTSRDSFPLLERHDLVKESVAFAGKETKSAEEEATLPTSAVWCCYQKFTDAEVECAYSVERAHFMLPRARAVLAGLAATHLVLLLMAVADSSDSKHVGLGLVLMVIGILAEAGLSCLTVILGRQATTDEGFLSLHWYWSTASLIAPLVVLVGAVLTRPSVVGNETFHMVLIATLARSPCFHIARHQAVVLPLLILIGLLTSVLLPLGDIVAVNVAELIFTIYIIIVDKNLDSAQRVAFASKLAMARVLDDLRAEREIRQGLLANALPKSIVRAFAEMEDGDRCGIVEPDCAIMLFSPRGPSTRRTSDGLVDLAAVVDVCEFLNVVHFAADCVVVVGPVSPGRPAKAPIDKVFGEVLAMLQVLVLDAHPSDRNLDVLVDQDSTVQVLHNELMPRYAVYGAGLLRLVTVHRLVDRGAIPGALVTKRCLNVLHELPDFPHGAVKETTGVPLRVRGAGIMRFVELKACLSD